MTTDELDKNKYTNKEWTWWNIYELYLIAIYKIHLPIKNHT